MKSYAKPVVLANDEVAEGVYAGSGDCYTANATMHQEPQTGRYDYRIQVNGDHSAKHHGEEQIVILNFNRPVEYKSSQGTPVVASGMTIKIKYNYHQNYTDHIGTGDIIVTSDSADLALASDPVIQCNKHCSQH